MNLTNNFIGKGVFANPKFDTAFKRCMGDPMYKDSTIGFLNTLLPDKNIVDVQFFNVDIPRDITDRKTIYIDVLCTDNNGNHFIVEMQRNPQPYFMQRMSYYAARVMSTLDTDKGDIAYAVKPCYVIAFLDFDMADASGVPQFKNHSSLHFITFDPRIGPKAPHPGSPEFFYFDLTKFKKPVEESTNDIEIWLSFFYKSNIPYVREIGKSGYGITSVHGKPSTSW